MQHIKPLLTFSLNAGRKLDLFFRVRVYGRVSGVGQDTQYRHHVVITLLKSHHVMTYPRRPHTTNATRARSVVSAGRKTTSGPTEKGRRRRSDAQRASVRSRQPTGSREKVVLVQFVGDAVLPAGRYRRRSRGRVVPHRRRGDARQHEHESVVGPYVPSRLVSRAPRPVSVFLVASQTTRGEACRLHSRTDPCAHVWYCGLNSRSILVYLFIFLFFFIW